MGTERLGYEVPGFLSLLALGPSGKAISLVLSRSNADKFQFPALISIKTRGLSAQYEVKLEFCSYDSPQAQTMAYAIQAGCRARCGYPLDLQDGQPIPDFSQFNFPLGYANGSIQTLCSTTIRVRLLSKQVSDIFNTDAQLHFEEGFEIAVRLGDKIGLLCLQRHVENETFNATLMSFESPGDYLQEALCFPQLINGRLGDGTAICSIEYVP